MEVHKIDNTILNVPKFDKNDNVQSKINPRNSTLSKPREIKRIYEIKQEVSEVLIKC